MTGRRYRILHTEASIGWGGQEIRVLSEAQKFAEEGHEVRLVCDPGSDIFAAAPGYGIERIALPMKKKSLAGLSGMRAIFRDWRPDVVNPHSSIDHWLSALARIGLGEARPAIVRTRHISAPVGRNAASRWLYNRGAEGLMATSRSIVTALTEDGFLPRGKADAVPTGIDTERFKPGGRDAARARISAAGDGFVFVIVATLRSWKGHSYLLDALAQIGGDARLVIVGDGPQEDNLREQIATLGLGERVTMAGRQADVLPFLQAADGFVLPSYANEGVPQAMLQAMACRLPIIACPTGGIPELAEGLAAVRFAEAKNAGSLAGEMKALMRELPTDDALDALRARVVENFSRQVMYRNALAAFERAMACRLPSPSSRKP